MVGEWHRYFDRNEEDRNGAWDCSHPREKFLNLNRRQMSFLSFYWFIKEQLTYFINKINKWGKKKKEFSNLNSRKVISSKFGCESYFTLINTLNKLNKVIRNT